MWFNRKDDNPSKNFISSDEYDKVLRRFSELSSNISILQTEVKLLQTNLDNLRGKFSQRLKGLKEEEQKQEEKEINSSDNIYFG